MYWQHEYLREAATMTRGQTYRIDLPESGLLSALVLEISADAVNGLGLTGGNWRLFDFLGLVEVIGNGAQVIKSLRFEHLHFLNWLRQGIVPPHFWRNYATNTQFEYAAVLFGRYLKDPQYGLDLSRWDNVELRITNSASASTHGNDLSIDIKQIFLREPAGAGFSGYLRSEIWRDWVTVADERKYHTLPVEFPFAGIYLQAKPSKDASNVEQTSFINLMDDVDFRMRGGTRQVFKGGIDHLLVENYLERGAEVFTNSFADVNADAGFEVGIGRVFGGAWGSGSKDGAGSAVIPTMEGDRQSYTQKPETREADSPMQAIWRGMGYQNMVWLWHSQSLEPGTLLDPSADAPIDLDIHTLNAASAASGTNRILLERLVTG